MKRFKKKYEYIVYLIILLIMGMVFFFCLGERGYVLEKDSWAFLEKKVPVQYFIYPKFLEICYNLFGEQHYLEWVSNIQGLFALVVSFLTTEYIRKNFKLNYMWAGLIFLCTFGPYAYSLPQYVSSHSIMTEGLAFPLFYLWMLSALQIYMRKQNCWFIPLLLLTLLMLYTRTQLTLFLLVCFIMIVERIWSFIYYKIKDSKKSKFIGTSVLVCIVCLFLGIQTFLAFIRYNVYPQMTDAVAGRVFCAAEKSDVELFEGKNKDLFLGIYDEIERLESRQNYFSSGIRRWEDIVNATNENTKLLGWIIRPYYAEIETRQLNDVKGQLAYTMMLEHWDDYLTMTGHLMLQSFVVAVFVHPQSAYALGYVIAILLYVLGIYYIAWSKKKYKIENRYIIPMIITLLTITAMCVVTNVLFMGLQRYVVYPFGFFYISLTLIHVGVMRRKEK